MNEKTLQILIAVTFIFLGIFFVIGEVLSFLGADKNINADIYPILSVIIFVLSTATGLFLLKDTLKKEEDE